MKYKLIRDIDNVTFEPRFRLCIDGNECFIYFNKDTSLYIPVSNELINSETWKSVEEEIIKFSKLQTIIKDSK